MGIEERDKYTGHMTTSHDWSGIKELNTKVPKAVWVFLIISFVFSVICWILYPAWPLGDTYTKGLLETDQKKRVEQVVEQAIEARAVWTDKIDSQSYSEIQDNRNLMKIVREDGRRLYLDNCAACHGEEAQGGPGFPAHNDAAWLWGGTAEEIDKTIHVGVNSQNEDSRISEMLAFGRDQMLTRDEILDVVSYVRSLSQTLTQEEAKKENIASGKAIFMENCVSCHGENAKGNIEVGAPDLTDDFWIYGGTRDAIFTTVWYGRKGIMPAWQGRLSHVDHKILTLYLMDLTDIKASDTKENVSN